MIQVRTFNPAEDYEMISDWWKAQEWPIIPLIFLPRSGYVSCVDGIPSAAAWLYQTDSALCWFEFIVANPKVRGCERTSALNQLFEHAKCEAKEMGFHLMFTSVRNASLMGRLESSGFKKSDENMTNLTYELQGGG